MRGRWKNALHEGLSESKESGTNNGQRAGLVYYTHYDLKSYLDWYSWLVAVAVDCSVYPLRSTTEVTAKELEDLLREHSSDALIVIIVKDVAYEAGQVVFEQDRIVVCNDAIVYLGPIVGFTLQTMGD
jgi:hypothetical protein